MITCQACGSQNLDSSQFCDECGDSLVKYRAPESNEPSIDLEPGRSVPAPPAFQSASSTSIEIPNRTEVVSEESLPNSEAREIAENGEPVLVIERGGAIGTEFPLASDESYIGRWDADNGIFPDVDLDSHDAEAKVSRKHARITRKFGQFYLEDLGSTNGTFVNRGRRLLPGNPHPLKPGDEIIVGKTFLRFELKG